MPILIEKKIGETPLELINRFKYDNQINERMSFAGRLDPMAHGKMILLKGIECKDQPKYCSLRKTYIFRVLFGVSTDTHDVLGKIQEFNRTGNINIKNLQLENYKGKFKQPYPIFSSKTVNGKPLWMWAKDGKINDIQIPSKDIEIYSIDESEDIFSKQEELKISNLNDFIHFMINSLSKENKEKFRAEEILEIWNTQLKTKNFNPIIKIFKADVSSGTYIRGLVHKMGKDLGCGAITLNIYRENINVL